MSFQFQVIIVLVLGVWASYQDLRYKKVKNWLLVSALAASVSLSIAYPSSYSVWPTNIKVINTICAAAASIVLWRSQIWPAGDAKLFTAFSILLPLDYYVNHFIPYFPAFSMLINTFFIGFSILTFMAIVDTVRHALAFMLGGSTNRGRLLTLSQEARQGLPAFIKTIILLMVFFLTTRVLMDYVISLNGNTYSKFVVLQFLLSFLIYRQVFQFIKKQVSIPLCIMLLVAGLFMKLTLMERDYYNFFIYIISLFRLAFLFVVSLQVLITVFELYIRKRQSIYVHISNLKEGMIVDRETWEKISNEARNGGGDLGKHLPDGLMKYQVELLIKHFPADPPVLVNRTFPFAPVLFCGMLLTMLLKQSALHVIVSRL